MYVYDGVHMIAKTIQIDSLRFSDRDLDLVGTLEYGQFGVVSLSSILFGCSHDIATLIQIDVVTCKLDGRLYVRKSTEKRFALRTREVSRPLIHICALVPLRPWYMECLWTCYVYVFCTSDAFGSYIPDHRPLFVTYLV